MQRDSIASSCACFLFRYRELCSFLVLDLSKKELVSLAITTVEAEVVRVELQLVNSITMVME